MATVHTIPQNVSLTAAADSFYLDRQSRRCSPYTLTWYHTYLDTLLAWLAELDITDVSQVTADTLRRWSVTLAERDLAERTQHHYMSAARAFFNYCEESDYTLSSPMRRIKMPSVTLDIIEAFTEEEGRRIITAARTLRDRALVLCLLDTGCRANEFVSLNVGDLDRRAGSLLVRHAKRKRNRLVYLGAKAKRALETYLRTRSDLRDSDPLWAVEHGAGRLSRRGLQRLLDRIGGRAGVEHCHPHTFRRTFALWSLRAGMDIYSLQRLLGHSDISMLRRYLALTEADAERAHREHGAVDSL